MGGLGVLGDIIFTWAHRMGRNYRGILIHTLELKLQPSEVFPCLYREAIRLQCLLPMRYVKNGEYLLGAHTNVTTFTYFGKNWSIGCLLALYGSTKHPAQLYSGFGQSVLLSLIKQKKQNKTKLNSG